jgi:hypothetical protein
VRGIGQRTVDVEDNSFGHFTSLSGSPCGN